ncbi:MAG TPA: acyltransferase [Oligoflexia bacterium]|nr:acyltransferase [Oligoflexia bacterium]HMP27370.1 acyltransferase [Oligoflexia bacterium]
MSEKQTPALTPQQKQLTVERRSPLTLYKEIAVGAEAGFLHFLSYELKTFLFGNLYGALGFGARALFYPSLFAKAKSGIAFGRSLVLRNSKKISLGAKILLDDFVALDARGEGAFIEIGDFASIGRFSTIAAKGGSIKLGSGVNIGSYCRIATNTKIEIAESVLVAAYCYIGPGNHQLGGDSETPLIARPMELKGGVKIGARSWIGAHATILDGVTIGEGSIIGAHSLVKDNIPAGCLAAGTPAKVIRKISEKA